MTNQQAAWQQVQEVLAAHPDREEGKYIPELANAIADYWAAVHAPRIAHDAAVAASEYTDEDVAVAGEIWRRTTR